MTTPESLTDRIRRWWADGYTDHETPIDAYGAEVLREVLAAMDEQCRWTEDDPHGCWETACGQASVFEDGGPVENHHRYCPYCGRPIEAVPYVPPEDDDDA